ncbi:MAG: ribose-5-phosphate isomerase RpiA [Maricaulaceae bacterium]
MSALRSKRAAAAAALDYVESGMTLALGSGSTAEIFVSLLGERLKAGDLSVRGVPSSEATAEAAKDAGVPLVPVEHVDRIHLCVDGADEIDPKLRLIKGGGGCLLREKILAHASDHMVVIADGSKLVEQLGAFPLPVEVDPFGFTITAKKLFDVLRASGCANADVALRTGSEDDDPFLTDGGHYILDCQAERIPDPKETARRIAQIPGVVEHGLFVGLARTAIIGHEDSVDILEV